mmetsp:Transcript_66109/g.138083  ORF Transcript_66109/g.138083 Transcript_66109/m.138083 type:complete len:451 (-) Transcript_66109:24-1376(-)|eukprot:CAMPEP_0206445372 /NCGR_PEP_ID=MMETSP0324_2-20121206/15468_1 /ASSEMBLY_ACC=CAM_ASM_000836 /TAXON_ID=2866 /ORGANISM="Crypthecodinium cohnii, Strain Seligo" /LENGTH=450 /DNA_ID=CAMNT_0053913573 /DNA_START=107 /DNA_END=1459 /DNA_ORIENTATION=+
MSSSFEYVILGGGTAGGYACREFVAQKVASGKVAMICAEPVLPYERPALTKAYLHPPSAKVRARLPGFHTCVGSGGERQTEEFYEKNGITIIKGEATAVDVSAKKVTVAGATVSYNKLIVATGVSAVQLGDMGIKDDGIPGIFYLRQETEAAALVKFLEEAQSEKKEAVVVGGGYIGLECAAALNGWGVSTTMVFPEDRIMSRLFPADLSSWLEQELAARGIKFKKGQTVKEVLKDDKGALSGVKLDGETLPCQIAVIGVGARANLQLFGDLKQGSGGLVVDGFMKTSDPSILAVGDICAFPQRDSNELSRCEHVDHARKSAAQAVRTAMGVEQEAYSYVPYFYSRIFEYTSEPIVFNFYGDSSGECLVAEQDKKMLGAAWVKDGHVVGALLMGSPGPKPEDAKRLESIAKLRPVAQGLPTTEEAAGSPAKKARTDLESAFEKIGIFAKL